MPPGDTQNIAVDDSNMVKGIELILLKGATISGVVADRQGRPRRTVPWMKGTVFRKGTKKRARNSAVPRRVQHCSVLRTAA
jgi:hypothetical protein